MNTKWFFAILFFVAGVAFFLGQQSRTTPAAHQPEPAKIDRTLASNADQQAVIDSMDKLILSINKKEDVKTIAQNILNLAKDPKNKDFPGVQVYGAIAGIVPQLEGIFYRCRAFVETSDFIHMSWLFGLRDFKYNNYLYGPHVDALFEYVTYPSEAAGPSFSTVSDLQNFLLSNIAPAIEQSLQAAYVLEKLSAEKFEFEFNRTIMVGEGEELRFLDPAEAKKKFIKANFYTIIFVLQRALATIYYVAGLDLDELPVVFNRVIRETTINTVKADLRLGSAAKGVTPQMTYEVFKRTKSFLKWKPKVLIAGKEVSTQEALNRAFSFGLQAAKYQLAAYVCGLKQPLDESRGQAHDIELARDCLSLDSSISEESYFVPHGGDYIFNPNSMALGLKTKYTELRDRLRMYVDADKGQYASVTSDVTGKTIQVNVRALFNAKVSQRDFLPTGYSASPARIDITKPNTHRWLYDHGKPEKFNDYTFGGFFHASEVNSSKTLYQAMTTVMYTNAIADFGVFLRVPSTARFFIPPTELIRAN